MDRRDFIATSLAGAAVAGASTLSANQPNKPATQPDLSSAGASPVKGRLKQSVCRWCYGSIPLDELCRHAAEIGLRSVELLSEKEWDVPAKYGLTCAVANGPTTIPSGLNRVENHDRIVKEAERLLPLIKQAGIPNMIVFSGNKDNISDSDGVHNCAAGLKRIMPLAESLGVTVVMEALNSKVDHKGYHCDKSKWCFDVIREVGSDRFKLLYDIYHMQIMEGDVIRTITDNIKLIGHFHTGGVPGRHEIDQGQELNYTRIAAAVADTGYAGFFGQEFIPAREPIASLREAAHLCEV
jgi:hydroxypyruvate isomerase